jgi:hypothetical protein
MIFESLFKEYWIAFLFVKVKYLLLFSVVLLELGLAVSDVLI